MTADASPTDRGLAVELYPLECGAPIRAGERPGHLEQTGRGDDGFDPETVGERGRRRGAEGVAGRTELLDHDAPEYRPLPFREAPIVAFERGRRLVAHDLRAVEFGEQFLCGIVAGDLVCGDVRIDLAFHPLPALCPEPRLVGGHRDGGA
jgi:hypothetical protein